MARAENSSSRQRLLDAAELLFTESGYQQVGIRDIATSAGFSTGAAHYHFSSKRELFLVIIKSRSENLVAELAAHLDQVVAQAAPCPPTARHVIGAFVAGSFAAQQGQESGRRLGRLMIHLVIAQGRDEFAASFMEILGPLYERYLNMLYAALPKRNRKEIEACFHFVQLVLMGVISDLHPFLSFINPGEEARNSQGLERHVLPFLAAGFESLPIHDPATISQQEKDHVDNAQL